MSYDYNAVMAACPSAFAIYQTPNEDGSTDLRVLDREGNELTVDMDAYNANHEAGVLKTAYEGLRQQRDRLLIETDWWAGSDRTMTAEQTAYRQALRDLPANTTDPENPVWPTKP